MGDVGVHACEGNGEEADEAEEAWDARAKGSEQPVHQHHLSATDTPAAPQPRGRGQPVDSTPAGVSDRVDRAWGRLSGAQSYSQAHQNNTVSQYERDLRSQQNQVLAALEGIVETATFDLDLRREHPSTNTAMTAPVESGGSIRVVTSVSMPATALAYTAAADGRATGTSTMMIMNTYGSGGIVATSSIPQPHGKTYLPLPANGPSHRYSPAGDDHGQRSSESSHASTRSGARVHRVGAARPQQAVPQPAGPLPEARVRSRHVPAETRSDRQQRQHHQFVDNKQQGVDDGGGTAGDGWPVEGVAGLHGAAALGQAHANVESGQVAGPDTAHRHLPRWNDDRVTGAGASGFGTASSSPCPICHVACDVAAHRHVDTILLALFSEQERLSSQMRNVEQTLTAAINNNRNTSRSIGAAEIQSVVSQALDPVRLLAPAVTRLETRLDRIENSWMHAAIEQHSGLGSHHNEALGDRIEPGRDTTAARFGSGLAPLSQEPSPQSLEEAKLHNAKVGEVLLSALSGRLQDILDESKAFTATAIANAVTDAEVRLMTRLEGLAPASTGWQQPSAATTSAGWYGDGAGNRTMEVEVDAAFAGSHDGDGRNLRMPAAGTSTATQLTIALDRLSNRIDSIQAHFANKFEILQHHYDVSAQAAVATTLRVLPEELQKCVDQSMQEAAMGLASAARARDILLIERIKGVGDSVQQAMQSIADAIAALLMSGQRQEALVPVSPPAPSAAEAASSTVAATGQAPDAGAQIVASVLGGRLDAMSLRLEEQIGRLSQTVSSTATDLGDALRSTHAALGGQIIPTIDTSLAELGASIGDRLNMLNGAVDRAGAEVGGIIQAFDAVRAGQDASADAVASSVHTKLEAVEANLSSALTSSIGSLSSHVRSLDAELTSGKQVSQAVKGVLEVLQSDVGQLKVQMERQVSSLSAREARSQPPASAPVHQQLEARSPSGFDTSMTLLQNQPSIGAAMNAGDIEAVVQRSTAGVEARLAAVESELRSLRHAINSLTTHVRSSTADRSSQYAQLQDAQQQSIASAIEFVTPRRETAVDVGAELQLAEPLLQEAGDDARVGDAGAPDAINEQEEEEAEATALQTARSEMGNLFDEVRQRQQLDEEAAAVLEESAAAMVKQPAVDASEPAASAPRQRSAAATLTTTSRQRPYPNLPQKQYTPAAYAFPPMPSIAYQQRPQTAVPSDHPVGRRSIPLKATTTTTSSVGAGSIGSAAPIGASTGAGTFGNRILGAAPARIVTTTSSSSTDAAGAAMSGVTGMAAGAGMSRVPVSPTTLVQSPDNDADDGGLGLEFRVGEEGHRGSTSPTLQQQQQQLTALLSQIHDIASTTPPVSTNGSALPPAGPDSDGDQYLGIDNHTATPSSVIDTAFDTALGLGAGRASPKPGHGVAVPHQQQASLAAPRASPGIATAMRMPTKESHAPALSPAPAGAHEQRDDEDHADKHSVSTAPVPSDADDSELGLPISSLEIALVEGRSAAVVPAAAPTNLTQGRMLLPAAAVAGDFADVDSLIRSELIPGASPAFDSDVLAAALRSSQQRHDAPTGADRGAAAGLAQHSENADALPGIKLEPEPRDEAAAAVTATARQYDEPHPAAMLQVPFAYHEHHDHEALLAASVGEESLPLSPGSRARMATSTPQVPSEGHRRLEASVPGSGAIGDTGGLGTPWLQHQEHRGIAFVAGDVRLPEALAGVPQDAGNDGAGTGAVGFAGDSLESEPGLADASDITAQDGDGRSGEGGAVQVSRPLPSRMAQPRPLPQPISTATSTSARAAGDHTTIEGDEFELHQQTMQMWSPDITPSGAVAAGAALNVPGSDNAEWPWTGEAIPAHSDDATGSGIGVRDGSTGVPVWRGAAGVTSPGSRRRGLTSTSSVVTEHLPHTTATTAAEPVPSSDMDSPSYTGLPNRGVLWASSSDADAIVENDGRPSSQKLVVSPGGRDRGSGGDGRGGQRSPIQAWRSPPPQLIAASSAHSADHEAFSSPAADELDQQTQLLGDLGTSGLMTNACGGGDESKAAAGGGDSNESDQQHNRGVSLLAGLLIPGDSTTQSAAAGGIGIDGWPTSPLRSPQRLEHRASSGALPSILPQPLPSPSPEAVKSPSHQMSESAAKRSEMAKQRHADRVAAARSRKGVKPHSHSDHGQGRAPALERSTALPIPHPAPTATSTSTTGRGSAGAGTIRMSGASPRNADVGEAAFGFAEADAGIAVGSFSGLASQSQRSSASSTARRQSTSGYPPNRHLPPVEQQQQLWQHLAQPAASHPQRSPIQRQQ